MALGLPNHAGPHGVTVDILQGANLSLPSGGPNRYVFFLY